MLSAKRGIVFPLQGQDHRHLQRQVRMKWFRSYCFESRNHQHSDSCSASCDAFNTDSADAANAMIQFSLGRVEQPLWKPSLIYNNQPCVMWMLYISLILHLSSVILYSVIISQHQCHCGTSKKWWLTEIDIRAHSGMHELLYAGICNLCICTGKSAQKNCYLLWIFSKLPVDETMHLMVFTLFFLFLFLCPSMM